MWFLISCSHAYAGGCRVLSTFAYLSLPLEREKNGSGVWMEIRSPKRITEVVFSILFFFPLINFLLVVLRYLEFEFDGHGEWVGFEKYKLTTHNPLKKKKRNDSHMSSAISIKAKKRTDNLNTWVSPCMHSCLNGSDNSKKQVNSPSPFQTFSSYIRHSLLANSLEGSISIKS